MTDSQKFLYDFFMRTRDGPHAFWTAVGRVCAKNSRLMANAYNDASTSSSGIMAALKHCPNPDELQAACVAEILSGKYGKGAFIRQGY